MEKPKEKICPRCGTPMEIPLFSNMRANVCQACGWGEMRVPPKPEQPSRLGLLVYATVSLLMVLLPFAAYIYMTSTWNWQEILVAFTVYLVLWFLYSSLGIVIELKANMDRLGWIGGPLLSPGFLLAMLVAILFFPGRMVGKTVGYAIVMLRGGGES